MPERKGTTNRKESSGKDVQQTRFATGTISEEDQLALDNLVTAAERHGCCCGGGGEASFMLRMVANDRIDRKAGDGIGRKVNKASGFWRELG